MTVDVPRAPGMRDPALVAVARMAPLAVQLAATPFVIATLGAAPYAVWALMMTTINLMLTADLGVVGIMQRYHGVARGRDDGAFGGRITATVLAVLAAVFVVVTILGPWLSRLVLAVVDIPGSLSADAGLLFRHTGTIAVVDLVALAFSSYLAAHERFGALALTSLVARSVLVVGIAVSLVGGHGLRGLLVASYLDAITGVVLGAWFCRTHLIRDVRRFTYRSEGRELFGYAWRNQASALGFVAQRELDVLMAGALLPAAALASVAAAAPLTAAVALAPTVLLTPVFTRLAVQAGRDPEAAVVSAIEADRDWFTLVVPYAALVLGILPAAAAAWIGPDVHDVATLTLVLGLGFLASLTIAVPAILVRAIGRPGLETRAYVSYVAVKLVLGAALATAFGPIGLASSGLVAALAMVATLRRSASRVLRAPSVRVAGRTLAIASVMLVVSASASVLVSATIPGRVLRLVVLGLVAAVEVVVWFGMRRVRPLHADG